MALAATQPAPQQAFVMESLVFGDPRPLDDVKTKDIAGTTYYRFPVAVIGKMSVNRTFYNVNSFHRALNDTNNFMRRHLEEQKLFGERNHPPLHTYKTKEEVQRRLLEVEPKEVSHHIASVELGKPMSDGSQVVFSWLAPHGDARKFLEDGLANRIVNTSFSLRASLIMSPDGMPTIRNGMIIRDVDQMVTFDLVTRGGFKEADKMHAAMESASYYQQFATQQGNSIIISDFAVETANNTELNDALRSNNVMRVYRQQSAFQLGTTYAIGAQEVAATDILSRMGYRV